MRKILLGLCLFFLLTSGHAQNGLEKIIVEKYYVSDATDAANSAATLPAGSVTWRIYVDMLPGYKFQVAYGSPTHTLLMNTTTEFFNHPDYGAVSPTFNATNAKKNTVMLDSWLSVGGACAGYLGILKSEDNGVGNFVNSNVPKLLQNSDPLSGMGTPLTTQDGMIAGAVPTFATIGLTTETDVFNDGSANGNTFTTNNGGWTCLAGSVGPTSSNRVLIAQITTNGTFHYTLNIQIGTPSGGTETYVASNPLAGEIYDRSLHLDSTLIPGPPTPIVNIIAPLDGAHSVIGDVVAIAANASEAGGSIAQVQFFVDGVSIGIDATAPYTVNYTGVNGTHAITAIATDGVGQTKTSAPVALIVGADPAPVVSITAPAANSSSVVGDPIAITANATDNGTIASVEFFVDGTSIGIDNTAPYTASYVGVLGTHSLTAIATDNRNQSTTSAPVSISVLNNTPPAVSITNPTNGQSKNINTVVPISANASDVDGTITKVEFFAGAISLGAVTTALYTINWTPTLEGPAVLTAVATDNKGATTTSTAVNVNVFDPVEVLQPFEAEQTG